MAVIFAKSAGLADDFWGAEAEFIQATMLDVDSEKTKDDALLESMFNVEKSDRFGEKSAGMTAFGDFAPVDEGAAAPLDDFQQTYPKLIEHEQLMKQFRCTASAYEDMATKGVNKIDKLQAKNFVRAYHRSRAKFGAAALCGEGATFTFGGKSYDRTTGDGKALFATNHTNKKNSATQSNVFTNAFGTDDVMLNRLANIGRNLTNDSGEVMGYTYDTIIIPGNCPRLEALVKKICHSDQQVGSNYNDINVNKGLWKMIVNPYWQAAEDAEPYIIMSSELNQEGQGNMFFDRIPLTVRDQIDIATHDLIWSGRARFSAGFWNWRHVIMGGAKTGTTLT